MIFLKKSIDYYIKSKLANILAKKILILLLKYKVFSIYIQNFKIM